MLSNNDLFRKGGIRMLTADEMFKKLDYKKLRDTKYNVIYEKGILIKSRIIFLKSTNTVCCILIDEDYEQNNALDVNMQELQAINKKCQELRLDMKQWKEIDGYERAIYNK